MDTAAFTLLISRELRAAGDPDDARAMQAYMKTDMPFYGVKAKPRRDIVRAALARFPVASADDYEAAIRALWSLPRREEKHAALDVALRFKRHQRPAALPLYERLIREGAWWDLVDTVASGCVSPTYLHHRSEVRPIVHRWIDDDDLWIRRAALLAHLKHKAQTDDAELFDFCTRLAHEKEFFIRKAIGWVLREYARANPDAVRGYLDEMGDRLSGLSRREAAKHL